MVKIDFAASAPDIGEGLRAHFVEGARWPVDRVALAALVGLGLSDATIAWYFKVEAGDVEGLRADYRTGKA